MVGKHRSSPLLPQARHLPGVSSHPAGHLHGRGWPGRLLQPGTWLTASDGGRVGTRHLWVLQGEVVGQAPQALPQPAGWGCLQARGWGAVVGTFPKSFPVALGPATSAPHPPPSPASPPRCSPGQGFLSGTMCWAGTERLGRGAAGHSRRERLAERSGALGGGGG